MKKFEKSCGAIIVSDNKILIVKQKSGLFGFPKGHIENNETEVETAVREVREETGLEIKIYDEYRYSLSFLLKNGIKKEVVYFLATKTSKYVNIDNNEIIGYEWVNINDVYNKLEFDNIKELWQEALIDIMNIM